MSENSTVKTYIQKSDHYLSIKTPPDLNHTSTWKHNLQKHNTSVSHQKPLSPSKANEPV